MNASTFRKVVEFDAPGAWNLEYRLEYLFAESAPGQSPQIRVSQLSIRITYVVPQFNAFIRLRDEQRTSPARA